MHVFILQGLVNVMCGFDTTNKDVSSSEINSYDFDLINTYVYLIWMVASVYVVCMLNIIM